MYVITNLRVYFILFYWCFCFCYS